MSARRRDFESAFLAGQVLEQRGDECEDEKSASFRLTRERALLFAATLALALREYSGAPRQHSRAVSGEGKRVCTSRTQALKRTPTLFYYFLKGRSWPSSASLVVSDRPRSPLSSVTQALVCVGIRSFLNAPPPPVFLQILLRHIGTLQALAIPPAMVLALADGALSPSERAKEATMLLLGISLVLLTTVISIRDS